MLRITGFIQNDLSSFYNSNCYTYKCYLLKENIKSLLYKIVANILYSEKLD